MSVTYYESIKTRFSKHFPLSNHIQFIPYSQVAPSHQSEQFRVSEFMNFMNKVNDSDVNRMLDSTQVASKSWTDEFDKQNVDSTATAVPVQESDWVQDFADHKAKQGIQFVC